MKKHLFNLYVLGDPATEWDVERARLNHDVLKNSLMTMILGFINIKKGLVQDNYSNGLWLNDFNLNWELFIEELEALAANFIRCCSPKTNFEISPLCECDNYTKNWLGAALHSRWVKSYRPYIRLAKLDISLSNCMIYYESLVLSLLDDEAKKSDLTIIATAEAFLVSLRDLSKSLNEFGERTYV